MATVGMTRLSTKGRVVIPEEIRNALGLEPGARFVVMRGRDEVILKRIEASGRYEFRALAARARRQASKAGLKPADVRRVVRGMRRRGRK